MKMDPILDRRSIRKFKSRPVPASAMRDILTAGSFAPSALNRQPRHFVVIDDRALLDRLHAALPNTNGLDNAPAAVIVCADVSVSGDYYPHDCSASIENMLIRATELGIGSLWCAVHPKEERMWLVKHILGLPAEIVPFGVVILGYPEEDAVPERPDRFRPERIHTNKW